MLKAQAKKLLKSHPNLYKFVRNAYQNAQYLKAYSKSRILSNSNIPSGNTKLLVQTSRIEFGNFTDDGDRALAVDPAFRGIASVEGGDWDTQKTRIEDMAIYKAVKQYLLHGIALRDSDYYAGKAPSDNLVTAGAWFKLYEQNYDDNVKRLDTLYHTIKTEGYRSQDDLGSDEILDEITVRISRNGEILFENSIHRLIIAKLLGIPYLPVVVTTRHSKWVQTRTQFYEFARLREGGKLYGKLLHPDLWDIPHSHECDDRTEMLAPYLSEMQGGNALDIGADLGIFSHMLEDFGFSGTAVEADTELAKYIKLLRDIEGKTFDVIIGDIRDDEIQKIMCSKKYDLVLGLNIFHHFLKKQSSYDSFIRLLNTLDMDAMLFQGHTTDEPQMQQALLNPEAEEFVQLILENSCLTQSEYIGKTAGDGRKIFLLTR